MTVAAPFLITVQLLVPLRERSQIYIGFGGSVNPGTLKSGMAPSHTRSPRELVKVPATMGFGFMRLKVGLTVTAVQSRLLVTVNSYRPAAKAVKFRVPGLVKPLSTIVPVSPVNFFQL